jgi:Arc/MetJ-type ribon-helix-helix transcriptional regulator
LAKKITIILDNKVLAFVDRQVEASQTKTNRSAFINAVLAEAQQKHLDTKLEVAYRQDVQDKVYIEEIRLWDAVAGDGMNA